MSVTAEQRSSDLDVEHLTFRNELPKQRRQFKGVKTLFMKPVTRNGMTEFEEVEGKLQIPVEYIPDKDDKFYRSPTLKEENKDDYYHVIASGNFADIIAARLVDNVEKPVAAKRYALDKLDETIDGYTRLLREIQISQFHRHENIVKFYETFFEYGDQEPTKPSHIWLVTERMNHTLEKYFEHLRRDDSTADPVKRDLRHLGAMLTQLLRALDYLHQRGIIHRDVTPKNIGMNQKEFEIKLLDFGLDRETNAKMDHSTNLGTAYISLLLYKPLEVLLKAKYDVRVDIWAAALVAIEMLGMKLFMPTGNDEEIKRCEAENAVKDRIFEVMGVPEEDEKEVIERPSKGEFEKIFNVLETRLNRDIGPLKKADFKALMKWMLTIDIKARPRADQCLQHPFLRILNEKYDQRAESMGKSQPRDDNEMKARNANDKEALTSELRQNHPIIGSL